MLTTDEWATQQWGTIDLGDQRLTRRALAVGKKMAAHPEASLPQQMQSPSDLEGAYRLMNNHRHIQMEDLLSGHYLQTRQGANGQAVVLWVEDTTELNYTAHPKKTGLGPVGDGQGQGLLMHSTLGLLPGSQTILGLGHVEVLLRERRPEKTPNWVRTPEGQVWQKSAKAIGKPPAGALWVHVSDRGSDIFEYMAECVDNDKHFLLRAYQNRVLTWGDEAPQAEQEEARKLIDYAQSLPAAPGSEYSVEVAATTKQPARKARLVMTWTKIRLSPSPQAPKELRTHDPLTVWVVRVWEPNAPAGVEAVEWVLLTSLPVLNLADARQMTDWYACRWLCEDFHQCLKTGCQVEHSQLSDGADIQNLLGLAAPIAIRLLQLRQNARHAPDAPAATVIDPLMVEVLARQQNVNAKTMSMLQFWLLIARLGGFQGRKRDGNPGWRTIWRGWRYVSDLTEGARLFVKSDDS